MDNSNKQPHRYASLFLHIPHAAPTDLAEPYVNTQSDAYKQMRHWAFYMVDHYTDKLFEDKSLVPRVISLAFPFSRMLLDVERMENDPLEAKGWGIVSQYAAECAYKGWKNQAMEIYYEWHNKCTEFINRMPQKCLLIDCHSFSAFPTPLCPVPPDVDICIGFNDDDTKPSEDIIAFVAHFFRLRGYKVGVNQPFSNSKTFSGAQGYHSLMIEVNKRCYMNEQTLEKTEGFTKLHQYLQELYKALLN